MAMIRLLPYFFVLLCFLAPTLAYGESVVVVKTVRQHITGEISPDNARKFAVGKAKRAALEEAGTYLETMSVVREGNLERDEIMALAVGVLKTEVVKEKQFMDGNVFCMEATVRIEVDPSMLRSRIEKLLEDREHLKKYQEAEQRNRKLLDRIARLEKENKNNKKKAEKSQRLQHDLTELGKGLDADAWFLKAAVLWKNEEYTDPQKALAYLSQAIELDPKDAEA